MSTSAELDLLEDELARALRRADLNERQAEAVAMRLGWDGKGGVTLATAGDHAGVTRERVRQLVSRVARHLASDRPELPALRRAVAELERIAPARRADAAARLVAAGISSCEFDPFGVLEAAEMVGLTPGVYVTDGLVIADDHADIVRKTAEAARKLVSHNGAANVDALADVLALEELDDDLARRLLETDDEVVWLDDDRDWFYVPTARNRAFNYLRKMLSVSPSLTLPEVREGLRRHHRSIKLPRLVIRGLCGQLDWVEVRGDVVARAVDLDYRVVLENTEGTLVEVFLDHGPVLDRQTAVGLAEDYGLDRTTAGLYLGWSPVIERLAINRYALRGANVPAGTLEAMRGTDVRRRVQQGHGWRGSGRLWIGYTLSQAVIDSNVVGVPGGIRDELRGRYALQPEAERLGELATDGQNIWGLARLLRRSGAEAGDALVLEFDLATSECFAFLGGPEILDPENGESLGECRDSPHVGVDDLGFDALLPPQQGLFDEQPTLYPQGEGSTGGVTERSADAVNQAVHAVDNPSATITAEIVRRAPGKQRTDQPEVVEVLLDRLDVRPERTSGESAEAETGTRPICIVPGCTAPGKNKLGVRCRVWHEPSPVPGKKKTSALWAPDADAFLCDNHALGGARITLMFEPDSSGETTLRVVAGSHAVERTLPIRRTTKEGEIDAN